MNDRVMHNLPPTEQLLAFKAVAELGSFTLAAGQLNITQSAVSHQIARLERLIGFRLLVRNSRAVTLTDAGERLYSIVARPLDDLMIGMAGLGQPMRSRRLVVQLESGFAAAWLSPRLHKFLGLHRNVQVEHRRASALNFGNGVDLAIKWGNGKWPHYSAEKLMQIDYTPICAPHLKSSIREVNDLRSQTLLHDRQYREWQQWLKLAGATNIDARRGHVVDDTNILLDMAISGQGVALSSAQLASRSIQSGQLVLLFPDIKLETGEAYYIVTKSNRELSDPARDFIEWLKAEVAS